MSYKFFTTCSAAEQKKRRSTSFPVLIALVISFSIFLAGIAHAQPSTGASALRLIGTVAGDITGAVLADSKGEQTFYRLHERLPDGSEIIRVRDDSITVKQADGAAYEIYINHDAKVSSMDASGMSVEPTVTKDGSSKGGSAPRSRRRLRSSSEQEE